MKSKQLGWKDLFFDFFPAIGDKRGLIDEFRVFKGSFGGAFGRFKKHNEFLEKNKGKIRVFADIGCSFRSFAPSTIEAKQVLGKNSEVYAIDVIRLSRRVKNKLEEKQLIPLQFDITASELPFVCDAIRFANVSHYMTRKEREQALNNIWKSLREKGFLLCIQNLSFEKNKKEKKIQLSCVLRKTKNCFELFEQNLEQVYKKNK